MRFICLRIYFISILNAPLSYSFSFYKEKNQKKIGTSDDILGIKIYSSIFVKLIHRVFKQLQIFNDSYNFYLIPKISKGYQKYKMINL